MRQAPTPLGSSLWKRSADRLERGRRGNGKYLFFFIPLSPSRNCRCCLAHCAPESNMSHAESLFRSALVSATITKPLVAKWKEFIGCEVNAISVSPHHQTSHYLPAQNIIHIVVTHQRYFSDNELRFLSSDQRRSSRTTLALSRSASSVVTSLDIVFGSVHFSEIARQRKRSRGGSDVVEHTEDVFQAAPSSNF